VGVAENSVGVLNGQTAERYSIAWVKEVGVGLFTKQGIRIWYCVAKCTWAMSRMFLGSR
jgi:hypothetical protein